MTKSLENKPPAANASAVHPTDSWARKSEGSTATTGDFSEGDGVGCGEGS